MVEAFLHGKMSIQQENMEDLWTSSVFGCFKLLPPSDGILPFLAMSQSWREDTADLAMLGRFNSIDRSNVDYQFWPTLSHIGAHRCEPDILIRVRPTKQLILVEAKLRSGKSTEADNSEWPYDQLARQWDNLLAIAGEYDPALVYLTADRSMPRESIAQSIDEFVQKRPGCTAPRIFWLSWQHINRLANERTGAVNSLKAMLRRLDLLAFDGWGTATRAPEFAFQLAHTVFVWRDPVVFDLVWSC